MDFIKSYNLKLITLSPLYIGDGRELNKRELEFAKELGIRISPEALRILSDRNTGQDAVRNISAFVRNGASDAYIPGSSIKGAIRTAILAFLVDGKGAAHNISRLERRTKDTSVTKALNTVDFENETYSVMRAISVSDSAPVSDDNLTICQKIDVHTDGSEKNLPIHRECIKPGVEISLRLNIDVPMFRTLTDKDPKEYITDVLTDFQKSYENIFRSKFNCDTPDYTGKCTVMYLGGSVGFVSKTVTYPLLGEREALRKVSRFMAESFRMHGHHMDEGKGISPHCLKCTEYDGHLYEFGLCEVAMIG